jgi:TPP-dependent 2-oxoacid decarboxylase
VTTKGELDDAMGAARVADTLRVIEVMLPPDDISPQLNKLSAEVVKRRG